MTNYDTFRDTLAAQYRALFELPDYAMAAARYTPDAMAAKFTAGLVAGAPDPVNKDGDGIRRTCKALKIPHTYKAIAAYLAA